MDHHKIMKWITTEYLGQSASGKTGLWEIGAVADDEQILGVVRWYGPWRQYVFHPESNTLWNPDCLDEVSSFVRSCTIEHRNEFVAVKDSKPSKSLKSLLREGVAGRETP